MRPRTLLASLGLGLLATLASTPAYARAEIATTNSPSIFVRVVDAQTAIPQRGAEVIVDFLEGDPDHPLETATVYSELTNGGGHAFFHGLPSGGYEISVVAAGYLTFGDAGRGDRVPTGLVIFRSGSGAGGNAPAPTNVVIRLVPLCPDCRISP